MRRRFTSKGNYLQPMYFEAVEDGLTVSIYVDGMEYRIGIDGEWKTLPLGESTPIIGLGEKIFFRRVGRSLNRFMINKKFKLGGDCRSLLHGEKVSKDSVLYSNCFKSLFEGSLVTEIEDDFLPATTLAGHCYDSMFQKCINLVKAPVLPATTLASSCYEYMFHSCSSLNYIKMLATDISATDCLSAWVYGVSPTGTFVKSKYATWDVTGTNGVPTGWTVITDDQEGEVSLISFIIGSMSYQAEEGMTWGEWVNSKYNTGGYYIDFDDSISSQSSDSWVGTSEGYVFSQDIIIEGYEYTLVV